MIQMSTKFNFVILFLFYSRLKVQYDAELHDMERAERQSREKYAESRARLVECEANIQNLHANVKQLEIQLSHSQRVSVNFSDQLLYAQGKF